VTPPEFVTTKHVVLPAAVGEHDVPVANSVIAKFPLFPLSAIPVTKIFMPTCRPKLLGVYV
jgi:hypothetical protein